LLSRLARDHPQHIRLLVGGVAFSQATMFARVLVLLIILNLKIFLNLLLPLASAGILFAIVGLLLVLRQGRGSNNESHLELKNPFELSTVLQFGALLTFVVFLVKIIPNYLGSTGIYILSAISGLADVDAITLSMARSGGDQLSLEVASTAIAIAVGMNTLSKAALGWITGGTAVGARLVIIALVAILVGAASYFFL